MIFNTQWESFIKAIINTAELTCNIFFVIFVTNEVVSRCWQGYHELVNTTGYNMVNSAHAQLMLRTDMK